MPNTLDSLSRFDPPVETALLEIFRQSADESIPLYKMVQYQLGWVDRIGSSSEGPAPHRPHGSLCIAAGEAMGAELGPLGSTASAVELLNHSIMVHEEMQIAASLSPNQKEPVWWIWGPAQAINVGDTLYALARLSLFEMTKEVARQGLAMALVREMDSASLRLYEGQYRELSFQERTNITSREYLSATKAKHGFTISFPLSMGAIASQSAPTQAEAIKEFGSLLGTARRIRSEIQDIWAGSNGGKFASYILNKTKLLTVVHILETGTIAQKRQLGELYFKRVMEEADIRHLKDILDGTDAKEYALAEAQSLISNAYEILETASLSTDQLGRWRSLGELILKP